WPRAGRAGGGQVRGADARGRCSRRRDVAAPRGREGLLSQSERPAPDAGDPARRRQSDVSGPGTGKEFRAGLRAVVGFLEIQIAAQVTSKVFVIPLWAIRSPASRSVGSSFSRIGQPKGSPPVARAA